MSIENRNSSLMENLRRLYNAVDMFFDRHAIVETVKESHSGGVKNNPVTAHEAFSLCMPIAQDFDRGVCLKLIVSPDGNIQKDGTSARWEFFFDLPKSRAQMHCEWLLLWNEEIDDFGEACIKIMVNPFPSPDSISRQMVKKGKLLHRQLIAMWKQEFHRNNTLPHRFRDSDETMLEFSKKGLDVSETEVTLKAEWKGGECPYWYVDGRDISLHSQFR